MVHARHEYRARLTIKIRLLFFPQFLLFSFDNRQLNEKQNKSICFRNTKFFFFAYMLNRFFHWLHLFLYFLVYKMHVQTYVWRIYNNNNNNIMNKCV